MMRAMESQAMDLLHSIEGVVLKTKETILSFRAAPEIVQYLQNYKRADLSNLETSHNTRIFLEGDPHFIPPEYELISGDLGGAAKKAALRKKSQNTYDTHKERLLLHEQAPIRDHDLEEPASPQGAQVADTQEERPYNSEDSRRRGRRGGRRRGPGARMNGPGGNNQRHPHHQGYDQRTSGQGSGNTEKPKKSWWQRLLE